LLTRWNPTPQTAGGKNVLGGMMMMMMMMMMMGHGDNLSPTLQLVGKLLSPLGSSARLLFGLFSLGANAWFECIYFVLFLGKSCTKFNHWQGCCVNFHKTLVSRVVLAEGEN